MAKNVIGGRKDKVASGPVLNKEKKERERREKIGIDDDEVGLRG